MAHVRDVMKKDIMICKTRDGISQISKLLIGEKISNLPIVDDSGNLAGVVSEQDIIKAMESEDFSKMTAGDIMTKEVVSVKEDDCLEYVSKIFVEHPFRRLPVTRNKKVVGIITREDIIQNFMTDYY